MNKMSIKKITWLLLVLFGCNLIFSGGSAVASVVNENVANKKVFDTGLDPLWTILDMEVEENIGVGKEFKVTITAQNMGSGVAFYPVIDFTQDDKKELTNFTVVGGENGRYKSGIERVESGETKTFTVTLKVNDDTKELPTESSYKITATLKSNNWDIGNGDAPKEPSYGTSKSFQVKPLYNLSIPTFVVNKITFDPIVVEGVEKTTATIVIDNISETKARNVTIALDGIPLEEKSTEKNITVLDISNTKRVGDVGGKKSATAVYQLEIDEDRKSNEMKMVIKYDGQKEAQEEVLNMPLPLEKTSSATGKVPKVIINKYVVEPSKVLAGNTVSLKLHIENTNTMPVNNVSIKLTVPTSEGNSTTGTVSGGTVFSPVNSSNTFYIERIEGKSTVIKDINLYVDANAQAKTYVVPVEITFEDVDGVEQKGGDNINIPVTQESKVEVIKSNIPTGGNVGMPVDYNIEFVNVGKVNLTNFKATLEGDIPGGDNNVYYVGTLEPSASDTFSGVFVPETEGVLTGKVVFSYRDADNQEARYEQDINMEVGPAIEMPVGPGDMPPPMEEENFFAKVKANIVVITLVGIILIEGIVLIRIKRKAKADEELFNG